ncbi:MAG TPA: glutathione peroxidase [Candidatus Limnocylindrales bacterium]|nr:glutathione peroxidase [Candidatus Limnocylindrales bacterium]
MLSNRENQRVPDVTFRTREGGEWKDVTTRELFGGRTVVVFALPGAFTPTCSASHLPRYEELVPAFRSAGVDEVVCISVNDGFIMEAWRRDQNIEHVRLIADGNGDFSRQMGMLVDKRDLGFGERSWRYSMLVRDGVIEKMFIEPEVAGDPYEVSDADTMLRYVAPARSTANVVVFSKTGCPHCARAKSLLDAEGMPFHEIEISTAGGLGALRAVSGAVTVPQVFIDGVHVGSADDLERHVAKARSQAAGSREIEPPDHAA